MSTQWLFEWRGGPIELARKGDEEEVTGMEKKEGTTCRAPTGEGRAEEKMSYTARGLALGQYCSLAAVD